MKCLLFGLVFFFLILSISVFAETKVASFAIYNYNKLFSYSNQRTICRDGVGSIYVTWLNYTIDPNYNNAIICSKSTDNGVTWSHLSLYEQYSAVPIDSAIACDGNNITVLIGSNTGILINRSTDNGITWASYDTGITDLDGIIDSGGTANAAFDSKGSNIYIVYVNSSNYNLKFINSTDGGSTWGTITTLASGGYSPTIIVNGTGVDSDKIYVAFFKIGSSQGLYFVNSTDAGATWGTATEIGGYGEHTLSSSININNIGNMIYIAHTDVNNQLFMENSSTGGVTWNSKAVNLSGNNRYPTIATSNISYPYIFWRQDNNIVYSYWNETAAKYSTPTNITIDSTQKNNMPNAKALYNNNRIEFMWFNNSSTSSYNLWYDYISFGTETVYPKWFVNQSSIPAIFNNNTISQFNMTWNTTVGEIDKVFLESNYSGSAQNYSMANTTYGGSIYNYSIILPAGTFYWKSYANDTSNNWNTSSKWEFTISKNTTTCTLYANETTTDRSYIFGQEANLTGTINIDLNVELNLSTNNTFGQNFQTATATSIQNISNTTTWNSTATYIKTYNWTVSYKGNANYSSCLATRLISIVDVGIPLYSNMKASPSSGISYVKSASYKFNSTWTDDAEVDKVLLEFNSTNYTAGNESSEYYVILNDTWAKSSGYSYKWFANDTSDNWASTIGYTYIIYDTPIWSTNQTLLVEYFNPNNISYFNITETLRNGTSTIDKVLLEINLSSGTKNYSMENSYGGSIYNLSVVLATGNYQWKVFANDSYNQWNISSIWYFTISKNQANPIHLNMSSNNFVTNTTNGNISVFSDEYVNISSWLIYSSSGSSLVYIDDVQYPNPYSNTFGSGSHAVIVNTTGNENYTTNSTGLTYYIISSTRSTGGGGGGGAETIIENITNITVVGYCGDGICEILRGENITSCALDCKPKEFSIVSQVELLVIAIAAVYVMYTQSKSSSRKREWEL